MLNIDNEFSKIKDYSFFNRAMFLFENNKYVNAIFVNEIVDKEYSDFSRCVNVTFDNIERCITLENIKEEGIYLSTEIKTNQSEPSTINEVFLIVDDEIPVGTDILYYIVTDNNDRIPIVPNGYTPLSLTEEMTGTIKLKADFKTNGNSSAKIYSYALMYFDNIIDNQLGLKEPDIQKKSINEPPAEDAHTHDNKTVLDNLNAAYGRLQYNGVDVCSGDGEVTIEYLNNNYYNKTATDYTLTSKVDKIEGKYLSTNDYTNEDKYKLTNLQNYIHPEGPEIRHVSDREKETWNSKAESSHSHSEYDYTTQLNELRINKYDDISIEGDELSLKANGVIKKTISLPASGDVVEGHTHSNKGTLDNITEAKVASWDNKSNFSGSYNDLADKPAIPTITNDLTDELKSKYDSSYIHSIDEHAPSNSQKNSDITKEEIEAKLKGEISSHTHNYAETTHSHSKADISDFEHTHNEYLTSVPTEYVTETELNSKGYLTQHQDISSKVDKVSGKSLISDSEITRLASVNNYNDTDVRNLIGQKADSSALHSHSNKTELDKIAIGDKAKWDAKSNFSGSYNDLTNKPTIPVITKEEIEAKLTGEITSHTHPGSGESGNKPVVPIVKSELEANENEIFIAPRGTAEFTTVLNNVNVAEDGTMTIANESVAKSAAFTITKDGIFVIETTSTNTGFYYIATKINGIYINGSWTKEGRRYDYVVKGGDTVTINFDNGSRDYTIKAYGDAKNDIIWKANNEFVNLSIGEQNVQSDWNSTYMFSDSYIKNKPYVTDNLTSTSATNILSARQGKFLDDKITTLNNKIGDSTSGLTKNVADNTANIAKNTSQLDDITNYATLEMFGAKGDGVTDDTQAFLSALEHKKEILLLRKYLISSSVTIPSNFLIKGLNSAEIISSATPILRIDGVSNVSIENVTLRSISTSNISSCILLNSSNKVVIDGCVFTDCKNAGIMNDINKPTTDTRIINCEFYNTGDFGVHLQGGANLWVSNNTFKDLRYVNYPPHAVYLKYSFKNAFIENNVVDGIEGMNGQAFKISSDNYNTCCDGVVIKNNMIYNCFGIVALHYCKNITIEGNYFHNVKIKDDLNFYYIIQCTQSCDTVTIAKNIIKTDEEQHASKMIYTIRITDNVNINNLIFCDNHVENGTLDFYSLNNSIIKSNVVSVCKYNAIVFNKCNSIKVTDNIIKHANNGIELNTSNIVNITSNKFVADTTGYNGVIVNSGCTKAVISNNDFSECVKTHYYSPISDIIKFNNISKNFTIIESI